MFIDTCRKQQQQVDRGDFSPCGTPTGLDARDPFDLQVGKLIMLLSFHLRLCLSSASSSSSLTCVLSSDSFRGENVLQYSRHAVEEEAGGTTS